MRRCTILILLTGILFSAFPQENVDYYYQTRITKFRNMKIGGIVLLSAGVIATVCGIAMISSAGTASYEVTYHSDGTQTESGDPVGGFGGVLVGLGIPMTAGGIVLTVIGVKKGAEARDEYRQKQLPLKLKIGPRRIALAYSF